MMQWGLIIKWGAIWHDGKSEELVVCEGGINSAKYMQILKEALLPIFASTHVNKKQHLFIEDGAPCDSAKTTQAWHEENGIQKLCWPSQSPDMSPIEHMWHIFDLAIGKQTPKSANKEIYPRGAGENSDEQSS